MSFYCIHHVHARLDCNDCMQEASNLLYRLYKNESGAREDAAQFLKELKFPVEENPSIPQNSSMEAKFYPRMESILFGIGLQSTLKMLVDALQKMMDKRGKDHLNLMILEGLRGLYNGYMRRHEPSDKIPDDYDFDMG